jgi:hypothetical protein
MPLRQDVHVHLTVCIFYQEKSSLADHRLHFLLCGYMIWSENSAGVCVLHNARTSTVPLLYRTGF